MSDHVRLFVTGGTFDKEYDERNGRLFFKDTHLREMLEDSYQWLKADGRL